MLFPANLLKGIPNETFLDKDGAAATHLFYFDMQVVRSDGWIEQSICWEDDNQAINLLFNQLKENGEVQFITGAARVLREEVDHLSRRPNVSDTFCYERDPKYTNPYHGNLLLLSSVPKHTMKKIAAGIALVSRVVKRP